MLRHEFGPNVPYDLQALAARWATQQPLPKNNIENNGRSPDIMEKLGSIPRTPTHTQGVSGAAGPRVLFCLC